MRIALLVSLTAATCLTPAIAAAQSAPPAAKPKPAEPDKPEVTVVGNRTQVRTQVDRTSFDVSKDLQAQAGTLADALRAVPGVEVDFEGKVSLRGDSGVKILVDGRESAMFSGPGRDSIISSMPAGQVERVEVINNPSAAMSPEGSAGVINIVMKQARPKTRSATVRANAAGFARNSLSLNAVNAGSKLTTSADLSRRNFAFDTGLVQESTDLATGAVTRREVENDARFKVAHGRLGLDYDVDAKNRLSAEATGVAFSNKGDSEELLSTLGAGSGLTRRSDVAMESRAKSGRLTWRRRLPGAEHELVVEGSIMANRFDREVDTVNDSPFFADTFESFDNRARFGTRMVKADYKRPLGEESSLNIGYEGTFATSEFDFLGARGTSPTALTPLAAFTNQFDYDERTHAVFGTYNFRLGELEAIAGLRVEKTDADIDQVTDGLTFRNDYLRAYPTLNLGFDLSPSQKIRAGYSRRIQRPGANDLNPYTVYIDAQNLRRGNPFLEPQTTDSAEIGWSKRKGPTFLSLTGFHRMTNDGVTDIFTDLGSGVILTTRANLSKSRATGVDAIASGKLTKTLSYNGSATLQHVSIDPRTGGISQERSGMVGSLRGTLNWQPSQKDFFQLQSFYNGRILLPQGYRRSGGVLNLGYRHKVDDRLSLSITGQNILDSIRLTTVYDTPGASQKFIQRGPPRILLFGFNYTIGSTTGKAAKPQGFEFSTGGEGGMQ